MLRYIFILSLSFAVTGCDQNNSKSQSRTTGTSDTSSSIGKNSPDNLKPDTISGTTNLIVEDIRREVNRINSVNGDIETYGFVCDTKGTIRFKKERGKVISIYINWGFVGDGVFNSEYYYRNDSLVFIFEKFKGGPAGEMTATTEERSYIRDNKVIKYTNNQKEDSCKVCVFGIESREYKVLKAYRIRTLNFSLCD